MDSAVDPFKADAVSKDASTAYATVNYKVKADDLTDASKDGLEKAVDQARGSGLTVEVGGTALASQPAAGGSAEAIGIALAAVVLLITFGSLAAAGLPLLTAVIGVGVSMCAILALGSTLGLTMTTGTLASMLGLAVASTTPSSWSPATARNARTGTPRGKRRAWRSAQPAPPWSSPV